MPKGYNSARRAPTKMYELVQLMRLNGFNVTLDVGGLYRVKRRGKSKWTQYVLTGAQMREKYGPGTTAYMIMTRHPRAATIVRAKCRQHEDLL